MTFSLTLKIDTAEMEKLMDKHSVSLRAALVRGLDRGAEIIEKAAKINLTQNSSVAFGVLRASIGHRTDPKALRVTIGPGLAARPGSAAGGDPQSYGFFVEHGRKPGGMPPAQDLELWVKRKFGIGDDGAVARAAFLISRKIAARGTAPAPFLVPAIRDNEARVSARIQQEIDREVDKINAAGGSA